MAKLSLNKDSHFIWISTRILHFKLLLEVYIKILMSGFELGPPGVHHICWTGLKFGDTWKQLKKKLKKTL